MLARGIKMLFTTKFIDSSKCPEGLSRKTYYESGLSLVISKNQVKSWTYNYQFLNKRYCIGLGSYPEVSLSEARKERARMKLLLENGKNPKLIKSLEKKKTFDHQANTIESLYELSTAERINKKVNPWSKAHIKRTQYIWKLLAPIHEIPIRDLTKALLRSTLVDIASKTPSSGQKAKDLMSVIYGYAVRNDIIPTNLVSSFSDDPILRKPKPDETNMQSFVPLDKLGHLFYLVKSSQMSMPSKAFLFIDSYTALRVNSLIGAKWSDYDEAKSILNISADKMKNNRATQCPLPFQAKVLLGELKEIQQMLSGTSWSEKMYIFSEDGKKRINNDTPLHSMKRILNKHNFPHATVHGFRTICQIKWTQDKFISEAINIQLDHSVTGGSSVVDRYLANEAFLPERAKMTQHMADYISSEITSHIASI